MSVIACGRDSWGFIEKETLKFIEKKNTALGGLEFQNNTFEALFSWNLKVLFLQKKCWLNQDVASAAQFSFCNTTCTGKYGANQVLGFSFNLYQNTFITNWKENKAGYTTIK